jgi:AraC-like DNA-binding protein
MIPRNPLPDTLREIEARTRRLSEPRTYWKGRARQPVPLPFNILLFPRREATGLLGHHPSQHHRFILIANLGGSGTVGVEDRLHALRPGQCLLIFPFQTHFYTGFSAPRLNWVFVSFESPRGTSLEELRKGGNRAMDGEVHLHLSHLLRAWQTPSRQAELPLHLELWLQRLIQTAKPRARQPHPVEETQDRGLVSRVNQLIFQNRHQPLSLDEMAVSLGCSTSFLRKRFREATGRSVGRHARETRLSHACELLHDTTLRIEEIATRSGYESLFAFSRAFHRALGRSPSRYRKEHRGPDSRERHSTDPPT